MIDILRKIASKIEVELEVAKSKVPIAELKRRVVDVPRVCNFADAFRTNDNKVKIIAELKKASPSKGIIRENLDVKYLATQLANSGATALSILTERNFFLGSLDNLKIASNCVDIPLLRKDFIFDEYQLYEARLYGADAILLIVSLLEDVDKIKHLTNKAHELGLSVLGEAHDEKEVEVLLECNVDLLGVNARNLRTFATDINESMRLIKQLPNDVISIAESAIKDNNDIRNFVNVGAKGFLIGETIMASSDVGATLQGLLK